MPKPARSIPKWPRKVMPLGKLVPWADNPREIDDAGLRGLEESLIQFGLVQDIVWNERTGRIVGGHQRVKALRNAGASEAEVVVVDLSEEKEKALNVTLNNPIIGGRFTPGLQPILETIRLDIGQPLFQALKLDALMPSLPEGAGGGEGGGSDLPPEVGRTILLTTDQYEVFAEAAGRLRQREDDDKIPDGRILEWIVVEWMQDPVNAPGVKR